jgi:hypothetical protein
MLKTAAKGYAWIKAPEAMKGVRRAGSSLTSAGDRLADRILPARRRARQRREAMLKGAAVAAISLPLWLWAGRRIFSRGGSRLG